MRARGGRERGGRDLLRPAAFNARLRADNFTEEELPEFMRFLHRHGVKGYVAFNTLVFTGELDAAAAQLAPRSGPGRCAHRAGPRARAAGPSDRSRTRIHASTQMTITSPEGLAFVSEQLGLDRAVLAREVSLGELEKFRASEAGTVPLEVFVHGALCVAYSGQCLTSEALGQRSANRGECAQACRMPYELVVDGADCAISATGAICSRRRISRPSRKSRTLIELGVRQLQDRGPAEVAGIRRGRDARSTARRSSRLDSSRRPARRQPCNGAECDRSTCDEDRYQLEMTFSRGLFTGWMHGVNHQQLVPARFGKKRGAFLGDDRARRVATSSKLRARGSSCKPGDGVVFDTGGDTDAEQGGRIYDSRRRRASFFDRTGNIDFAATQARHIAFGRPTIPR